MVFGVEEEEDETGMEILPDGNKPTAEPVEPSKDDSNIPNDRCILRDMACRARFESTRTCFIAASTEAEEVLDEVKEVLGQVGIEPCRPETIHLSDMQVFCENVCSKVIESLLCIAFIGGTDRAVHFEYGLMTALGKKIIPVQLGEGPATVNVHDATTIRFTRETFAQRLDDAVRLRLLRSREVRTGKVRPSFDMEWVLDFLGLIRDEGTLEERLSRSMALPSLDVSLYKEPESELLCFVRPFGPTSTADDVLLLLKVLLRRLKNHVEDLSKRIREAHEEISDYGSVSREAHDALMLEDDVEALRRARVIVIKDEVDDKGRITTAFEQLGTRIGLPLRLDIVDGEAIKTMMEE